MDIVTYALAKTYTDKRIDSTAILDESGKVPSSMLPSYVDDIVEYDDIIGFPLTGEKGKIYVALNTNKIYRWSGSAYIEIISNTNKIPLVQMSEADTMPILEPNQYYIFPEMPEILFDCVNNNPNEANNYYFQFKTGIQSAAIRGPTIPEFFMAEPYKIYQVTIVNNYLSWKSWDYFLPGGTSGLQYDLNPDGISYSVSLGTARDSIIVIPKSHNGYSVTEILWRGFANSNITEVYIPNSINKINDFAFFNCNNLKKIKIMGEYCHFGTTVFNSSNIIDIYLTNLASWLQDSRNDPISYAKYNLYINDKIFTTYSGADDYLLLNEYGFYNCLSIERITDFGFEDIPKYSFANCYNLKTVNLDNVYSIKVGAFSNCCNLFLNQNLLIEVPYIEDLAFYGCGFFSIQIGRVVAQIGSNSFSGPNLRFIYCYNHPLFYTVNDYCLIYKDIYPDKIIKRLIITNINSLIPPDIDIIENSFDFYQPETIIIPQNITTLYTTGQFSGAKNVQNIYVQGELASLPVYWGNDINTTFSAPLNVHLSQTNPPQMIDPATDVSKYYVPKESVELYKEAWTSEGGSLADKVFPEPNILDELPIYNGEVEEQ